MKKSIRTAKVKKYKGGLLLIALGLISITLVVLAITIGRQLNNMNNKINFLTALQRKTNMALDNQKTQLKPALNIDENKLAFPEIKIQIPYNNISNTFIYANKLLKGQDSQKYEEGLDISSTLVGEDPFMAQLSCQQLVRLSFINGVPYSPWEEYAGEVKLNDGRTLYIIKATAYENNEASNTYCPATSWQQITPDQVAELFKAAESY